MREETSEPWVPLPPEDARPDAEAVECFCGTTWYPEIDDYCPSCGREESEIELSDEELEE